MEMAEGIQKGDKAYGNPKPENELVHRAKPSLCETRQKPESGIPNEEFFGAGTGKKNPLKENPHPVL